MTVHILFLVLCLVIVGFGVARRLRGRRQAPGFGGMLCGAACMLVLTLPATADAASAIEGKAGDWGIGAVVPDPIGVTGKWFFADQQAVEVAFGFDGTDTDEIVLRGSYLWHFTDLWNIQKGNLPLYIGVGGRFEWDDDEDDVGIGIRAPVGVAWWMERQRWEIFGELAPLFEIEPDDDFSLTVAAGIRWYP